ncbi:hypothetical protein BDZ91DRAFT_415153 [Kalaharituber pfeilii]|nr:hypothetical protein BDZ91DRAFT_415153 [Kalaharituber pfeilii]
MTMPAPLSPMFTIVSSPKNAFLDTHVMAVVTVRREIEESPGTYLSAMSAVFSANSIYNQTRVTYEKESISSFQLRAMVEALSAAYNAQVFLKAAGCQRLVITIDRDMEWIARVLCRFHDLVDRAVDDEVRLYEYVRYPEQISHLVEFLETFEAVTKIKVQFWPTEKDELTGAYLWASKAIDHAISNYERDYYGVFDDSDYDEDYDEEMDEDEFTNSDEEPEPKDISANELDTNPKIVTDCSEDKMDSMDPIDVEHERATEAPVMKDEVTNVWFPEAIQSVGIVPFEKMIDVSEINYSGFPGTDGKYAYVLAQIPFGTTNLEELLLAPPFRDAADSVSFCPDGLKPPILCLDRFTGEVKVGPN